MTYSKKAIPQSKVPNSNNIEDIDAGSFSNDATDRNEENTSGIQAF